MDCPECKGSLRPIENWKKFNKFWLCYCIECNKVYGLRELEVS
ncbi:hypothetical protein LCGC14_1850840 [marine sediment metagenome]|uniref:Uncharacterized protein n=1 Tax=marine sediment metagenome TaxID=412755 RepID=A0A0F9IQ15_9ZZZZ